MRASQRWSRRYVAWEKCVIHSRTLLREEKRTKSGRSVKANEPVR